MTKTSWSEPPRLRHQLARMLVDHGHDVVFLLKPKYIFQFNEAKQSMSEGIKFIQTYQLIHHKLRLTRFLHWINSVVVIISMRLKLKEVDSGEAIIINFNYDYYFLKKIFQNNKIITIINDDFWCRAILGYKRPLVQVLSKTCEMSDEVLSVSYPLKDQLDVFKSSKLFLPWTNSEYTQPLFKKRRNVLLFWGYINNRLNVDYITILCKMILDNNLDIEIHFVGPIDKSAKILIKRISIFGIVKFYPQTDFKDLNTDTSLAAFVPYIDGNISDDVTTLPNKALFMLSRGLPLYVTGMPNLVDEPFVYRMGENIESDLNSLKSPIIYDSNVQLRIKEFVNQNNAESRYMEFSAIVSKNYLVN